MANLKEIRNRIASVGSTMQTTNAMKMVSVAKLRKSQAKITAMSPYANKISELIQRISSDIGNDIHSPFTLYPNKKTTQKNILLVAITSNKGLCGAFNINVIKEVTKRAKALENHKVTLATIGKKGDGSLKKKFDIDFCNIEVLDNLNFDNAELIAQQFMDDFVSKKYDEIHLIYNHFLNAATQEIMFEQFLPIQMPKQQKLNTDYIYEPSKKEIIHSLIPKALKVQFFKALVDSSASEHGARMTAMHKATDNAMELKDQLTLAYNKARQAAITNEILEIVGGAEALKN